MKISKILLLPIVFGLMFFLSSCRDIDTTTQVFSDGSCQRTVVVDGDSSDIYDTSFPIPHQPEWEITEQDEEGEPDYVAKRTFASVTEMNDYYQSYPHGEFKVPVEMKLKKRFRWFSTFYRYSELYQAYNPFKDPPITEYFTEQELEFHAKNGDHIKLRVDKKFELWWWENTIENLFKVVAHASDSLQLKEITVQKISEKKKDLRDAFDRVNLEEASTKSIMATLNEVLQSNEVQQLKPAVTQFETEIEKITGFIFGTAVTEYSNEIMMPGLIVKSNAKKIEGNSVRWELEGEQFLFIDYEMWVESRIVNRWAMIVTGVICLLLVAGLLFGTFLGRKRRDVNTA